MEMVTVGTVHGRTSNTCKTDKHVLGWYWGRVGHHLSVSIRGGGDLGEYKFLNSAYPSSLSEQYPYWPNRCVGTVGVWNPNLGALDSPGWHNLPLTTALPCSYILIARYTSSATHSSQHNYTIKELHKKNEDFQKQKRNKIKSK